MPTCCPFCASPRIEEARGPYFEIGAFDGKQYENEGELDGYKCDQGHHFYVLDDGSPVG